METLEQSLTIKLWAEEDRPREKLLGKGRNALSDAELIAILIGSGSRNETAVDLSKKILASAGNNLNELGKLSVNELTRFKGIGEAKAISIVAAMELGRRRKEENTYQKEKIITSADVFYMMKPELTDLHHEEFWVLLLNRANKFIRKVNISKGGMSGTVVDARVIFKLALENSATGIVLCHNHPSGSAKPSKQDIELTKQLKEAGKLLEIKVLDHVIIADKAYFSFADERMM